MGTRVVTVWNERCTVETYQKSKSVWVATGECMGETHSAQDRSEGTALMRWREWAQYTGD